MARTVADCALYQNAISGAHPRDHVSVRHRVDLPEQLPPIDGMRVAVSVDLGDWPVDDEIAVNTRQAAATLRAAGAVVEEVDLSVPRALVMRAVSIHFNLIFAALVDKEIAAHGDLMCDYALDFARRSKTEAAGATLLDEYDLLAEIYEPVGALLEQYDVLICPTIGTRGLVAGDSYVGHGLSVGGVELEHYFDSIMTAPFNAMSRCPVLAVPSGFADNGVPTGVQIVGRTYDDETVFRVGAALERVQPWFDVPARRPAL
jgi:Asp-tRNA(Asn)/Glu-tRNA(Gln) amidotransferase A subunit family amidase